LGSGGFELAQAVTIATLEQDDIATRDARLAAADGLVSYLPTLQIEAAEARLLMQGQQPLLAEKIEQTGLLRAYYQQQFLGLVQLQADNRLIPQRLMASRELLESV
jgi:tRNA pseudouridine55 synthase